MPRYRVLSMPMNNTAPIELRFALVSVFTAAIFASLSEGILALVYTLSISKSPAALSASLFFSFCIALSALTIPAVFSAWFVSRPSVQFMLKQMRVGLSGFRPGGISALFSFAAAAVGAVAISYAVGIFFEDRSRKMSSAVVEAVLGLSVFVILIMLAPFVSKTIRLLCRHLKKKRPAFTIPPFVSPIVLLFTTAVILGGIIALFLKADMALLPMMLFIGLGVGLNRSTQKVFRRFFETRARLLTTVGAAILIPLTSLSMLDLPPDATRQVLLTRSPYTGTFLGLVHSFFDRDRDGYASILLGGDCDDSNFAVNPGAPDMPGNGIDEDCSGADAQKYRPPKKPSFKRPVNLPDRMNVILILLDALRPDHVRFAGYDRKTTESIDKFRKSAVWFKRAYTPTPVTQSAMLSLFTGFDFRLMPRKYVGYKRFTVSNKVTTIAERLKREGYSTSGYTISYIILSAEGIGQGFDMWKTPWPVKQWAKARRSGASMTTKRSIEQLKSIPDDGSRPFLFFIHYFATHAPYYKHDRWNFGDNPVDRYDSALAYNDSELGRLLGGIDKRKDRDNTAVILFSDHGEMLQDHGLTEHGRSLYESETRTLLLARIPGTKKKTVDSPVLISDIAPTVSDLAGIDRFEDKSTSISLIPYIFNNYRNMERPLFLFTECQVGAVQYNASALVRWPYKYIRDRRAKTRELYDVDKDPGEENNLVDTHKERAGEMSSLLESFDAFAKAK